MIGLHIVMIMIQ